MKLWLVVYADNSMGDDAAYQFDGIFHSEKAYEDIEWIHVKEFSSPETWQGRALEFGFKKDNYSRHWSRADYMVDLVDTNKRKRL